MIWCLFKREAALATITCGSDHGQKFNRCGAVLKYHTPYTLVSFWFLHHAVSASIAKDHQRSVFGHINPSQDDSTFSVADAKSPGSLVSVAFCVSTRLRDPSRRRQSAYSIPPARGSTTVNTRVLVPSLQSIRTANQPLLAPAQQDPHAFQSSRPHSVRRVFHG